MYVYAHSIGANVLLSLFPFVALNWLVPNRRVPIRRVLPVAVPVGIGLEIWKYLFLFAWPWLDRRFTNEYGDPLSYSVSIVFFSMLTALIVLAGAE